MATAPAQPDAPVIKPLAEYDMSHSRGFLCRHDAGSVTLPGVWADAAAVALQLPQVLLSGQVRAFLKAHLPAPQTLADVALLSNAELRMAAVHYSFMVQSYVWGETQRSTTAFPPAWRCRWWRLADRARSAAAAHLQRPMCSTIGR